MPAHRRNGPGIFQALGQLVMHGRGGVNGGAPYVPVQYPVPPVYPVSAYSVTPLPPLTYTAAPETQAVPAVNPAVRAAESKELRENKEVAEANGRHRWHGSRKSYIPSIGMWPNKAELLEIVRNSEERTRGENPTIWRLTPQELEAKISRETFALMKQYKLSKHEPTGMPDNRFGKFPETGAASNFYNGNYQDVKGWRWMLPKEKDAMMASESDAINMPRIAANQAERRQIDDNLRYAQQARQAAEQWERLPPAEREMITYNRQLAEYNEAVQRNQYVDMVNQQQQNQQPNFGPQMGEPMMSPVMLDNLATMAQGENTQYVPVRPRRSINERIMRSFDPNMFSPEFIPEEENGY